MTVDKRILDAIAEVLELAERQVTPISLNAEKYAAEQAPCDVVRRWLDEGDWQWD